MRHSILIFIFISCLSLGSIAQNRVFSFNEGMASFITERGGMEMTGAINNKGEVIVQPGIYDWISDFNNGFAVCKKNDKYGYINILGKEIIPCGFDYASQFSNGFALVGEGRNDDYSFKKLKTIDTKGATVYEFSALEVVANLANGMQIYPTADGFLIMANSYTGGEEDESEEGDEEYGDIESTWYYINHLGQTVSEPKYKNYLIYDGMDGGTMDASDQCHGEYLVTMDAKGEGWMNQNGKQILNGFTRVLPIGNSISCCINDEYVFTYDPAYWERYDLNGNKLSLPPEYSFSPFEGNLSKPYFPVVLNSTNKLGLVDKNFKPVSEFIYYRIDDLDDYGYVVAYRGKEGCSPYDRSSLNAEFIDIICPSNPSRNFSIPTRGEDLTFKTYSEGIVILYHTYLNKGKKATGLTALDIDTQKVIFKIDDKVTLWEGYKEGVAIIRSEKDGCRVYDRKGNMIF